VTRPPTSQRVHFLVFLLFVAVTLGFTYPLIAQMGTNFAGDNIDVWLNMWANWWTRKALRQGLPFYHTTDILYPNGVPLYFHSFSHTNTALWLLLEPLVGPLAAYNAAVLLGFVLLGFGLYLLVHTLTGSVGAGVFAGLAAAFAPYHVWECVHPILFSTQYIPFLLWALVTLFRRPTWWRGVLAGLFFTLGALSGWHQAVYAAVIAGPYLAWNLVARRRRPAKGVWSALLLSVLVAVVLLGPAFLPLLREQVRAGYAEADINWVFDTDLLALVTPSFLHPLWGDVVRPFYDRFPAPNRPVFVGYAVLGLALVGLFCLQRKHGWLAVATPLALLLAVGTKLYVGGGVLVSRLPWYEPIIGFIRTPVRLNLVLGQCLALLAGLGVARISEGCRRWGGAALPVAFSILALFEFLAWPFPTTPSRVSPFYARLAQEPGDFAIVEAPLDRQTDKFYMYWQTFHGRPLVNGHVSRPSPSAFDFVQSNALTRAFAERTPLRGQALGVPLTELAEAGVRYVVVHKEFLPAELAADWVAALAMRPVYEDDDLAAFATQPQAGVHFGLEHSFDGLLLSQAWLEPGQPPVLESHWSAPDAVTATVTVDGPVSFVQEMAVEPGVFSVARTPLSLSDLPPGVYTLRLSVGGESLVLPWQLIVVPTGWFAARLRPEAVWEDTILLRGIDWHRLANTLYIDIQWEAQRSPGAKFFIHLLGDDGVLAAQFDGVPCDWAGPTSGWVAGELVSDRVGIDLRDVPAGMYTLALGWYEPDTGRRLGGADASGQPLPEGLLLLDRVVAVP